MLFTLKKTFGYTYYKFPKNNKGEYQLWVPYVIENKNKLIDLIDTFTLASGLTNNIYAMETPEIFHAFMTTAESIKNAGINFDALDVETKGDILNEFADMCSTFSVTLPITRINSTEYSGIMPDGRFVSDIKSSYDRYMLTDNKFSESADRINDDGEVINFWSFDCPFCGVPYSFASDEHLPHKNFSCSNCDNMLIYYTKKDTSKYIPFNGDSHTINFLNRVLKKKKQKEVIDAGV